MSSGQTFTDVLNLYCDFDPEHSNPIFHIRFASKRINSSEDIVATVIF